MAYQALYRKYRPDNFEGVAGQKAIVQTLKNAVNRNKIAHAYLFCGPRGTGKTSIAKIFAKMLNCEDSKNAPCGKCKSCLDVQKGSHPDIIEIDAASNNGVDEVRNLIEKVKYAPIEGKYKVYIIDEVHMMSTGAFNALLKTIEEPPAHVIFIFATTEPHKVLPTIISRCQRYDFNKVNQKDMIERLHYVLNKEKIQMDEEAIQTVAILADGGMRDALSILDQCIAYAQDHIRVEDVNAIYGITTVKEKGQLFQYIIDQDYIDVLSQIEDMNEKGIDIRRLTSDLIDLLKESMIYSYTKDKTLVSSANITVIESILDPLSNDERFQMLDVLMDTFEKYRNASDVASYFEVAILKLFHIKGNRIHKVDQSTVKNDQQLTIQKQNEHTEVVNRNEKIETPQIITKASKVENEEKNVSRETFKKQEKIKNNHQNVLFEMEEPEPKIEEKEEKKETEANLIIEDSYVLRLLVGANKQERQLDDEKFKDLSEYMNELEWIKYANLLRNAEIVASGKSYIVLAVNSEIEAKEINQIEYEESFVPFTNQLLGISKKVFAIDIDQKKRVISKFKELMIQGKLPEPVHLELKSEKKVEKKEETIEEKLTNLFGEEIVIMEE